MEYKYIMIRYGEIGTKGKNKRQFIACLYNNIKNALKQIKAVKVYNKYDRLYVALNGVEPNTIFHYLDMISGIATYSPVYFVETEVEKIKEAVKDIALENNFETFKVSTNRADKRFEIHSMDFNKILAGIILKNKQVKVDIHNPDANFNVEIREEGTYIFFKKYKGLGGYPLGIGGKALALLSGGIDSPVACFMMMKRGVALETIHFASFPYTSKAAEEKVYDLLDKLNVVQPSITLHIVPFTKLQEEIYKNVDESYAITIMRRMMVRISSRLAKKRNCLALVTGESVGQVASQTLNSMQVINDVTNMPIIRPVACFDKLEIMDVAKKIDTYEISIRPFEDCCTIFTPKNPVTKPMLEKAIEYESKFDYESLIQEILENIETKNIYKNTKNDEEFF